MAEDVHPTKAGSLIDKVWHLRNLRRAWTLVQANHGMWGGARQSLGAFEAHVERTNDLLNLQVALQVDAYVPLPGRRVYIPQPDGRRRGLAVPAVGDRVVQTAIRLRLELRFEARFAETRDGFRPGRSAHQAIGDVIVSLHQGGEWIEKWTSSTSSTPRLMNGCRPHLRGWWRMGGFSGWCRRSSRQG